MSYNARLKKERDLYFSLCLIVQEFYDDHLAVDLFQCESFREQLESALGDKVRPHAPDGESLSRKKRRP